MFRRGDLNAIGVDARITTPSWIVSTKARAGRAATEYDSIQCHLARWFAVDSIVGLSGWAALTVVKQFILQKGERLRGHTGNECKVWT